MGLFDRMSEENRKKYEEEKQRLMLLSEKELMVEILIELKLLNRQGNKIALGQVIWRD